MKTVRFGRSNDNDVVLNNPTVSRHHFSINFDGLKYTIQDLGSSAGTFVNGNKVSTKTLQNNDIVKAGDLIINWNEYFKESSRVVAHNYVKTYSIGRNSGNQIVINNSVVSGFHAKIHQTSAGDYIIEDCNSTNGTFVNNQKIQSKILNKYDKVSLGSLSVDWYSLINGLGTVKSHNEIVVNKKSKNKISTVVAVLSIVILFIVGVIFIDKNTKTQNSISFEDSSNDIEKPNTVVETEEEKEKRLTKLLDETSFSIYVYGKNNNPKWQGTGFFISEDGLAVSNHHVMCNEGAFTRHCCDQELKFLIRTEAGLEFSFTSRNLVGANQTFDLAKFKVPTKGQKVPYLKISTEKPEKGQRVYIMGNGGGLNGTFTVGRISGIRSLKSVYNSIGKEYPGYKSDYKNMVIQTDATVNSGNSGGPMINSNGEVIGVVSFKLLNSDNTNFAMNSKLIDRIKDCSNGELEELE